MNLTIRQKDYIREAINYILEKKAADNAGANSGIVGNIAANNDFTRSTGVSTGSAVQSPASTQQANSLKSQKNPATAITYYYNPDQAIVSAAPPALVRFHFNLEPGGSGRYIAQPDETLQSYLKEPSKFERIAEAASELQSLKEQALKDSVMHDIENSWIEQFRNSIELRSLYSRAVSLSDNPVYKNEIFNQIAPYLFEVAGKDERGNVIYKYNDVASNLVNLVSYAAQKSIDYEFNEADKILPMVLGLWKLDKGVREEYKQFPSDVIAAYNSLLYASTVVKELYRGLSQDVPTIYSSYGNIYIPEPYLFQAYMARARYNIDTLLKNENLVPKYKVAVVPLIKLYAAIMNAYSLLTMNNYSYVDFLANLSTPIRAQILQRQYGIKIPNENNNAVDTRNLLYNIYVVNRADNPIHYHTKIMHLLKYYVYDQLFELGMRNTK